MASSDSGGRKKGRAGRRPPLLWRLTRPSAEARAEREVVGGEKEAGAPPLVIAPLMSLPCDLTDYLPPLVRGFRRDAVLYPLEIDLTAAYDGERDQYLSTHILRSLLELRPPGAHRIVGVVDVDLFVPILTYVFGEAQLGGMAAVVSIFRLREPWLRGGASPELVHERLAKTLLHELAHTHGLRHCPDPHCVMASASSLEMLDEKTDEFCLDCQAELAAAHDRVDG